MNSTCVGDIDRSNRMRSVEGIQLVEFCLYINQLRLQDQFRNFLLLKQRCSIPVDNIPVGYFVCGSLLYDVTYILDEALKLE